MSRLSSYLGSTGLGFLIAGALLWVLQPSRDAYWASFLIVGLVLCAAYLATRWKELSAVLASRGAKEGANSALLVAIVVAIVGIVNYLADRYAKQWDSTATKQYSLSEQTTRILAELEHDVEIVLLERRATEEQVRAEDLLSLYDDASTRVRVELIDPEAEPERALAYTNPTEPVALGTVIVDTGERQQRATAATEVEITNTLIRALKSSTKKIYFTTGHREKDLADSDPSTGLSVISNKLTASAYEPEALVIARSFEGETTSIPEDAAALVVAGPLLDFLPEELDAIDAFIEGGGSAIFLVDPKTQSESPELVAFLAERGIALGEDVVVDALAQPPLYPVVQSYSRHPVVESFGNVMSIFPLARSVSEGEHVPEGTQIRELFTTADENSWAETRPDELAQRRAPTDEQRRGPIGLAMAATIEHGGDVSASRLVVVGDSDFIANQLANAPLLNADLFLNMVNWVAQDEDLISIRPREAEERRVAMNEQQRRNVLFLSIFIIPGIAAVTGLSLWWSRR